MMMAMMVVMMNDDCRGGGAAAAAAAAAADDDVIIMIGLTISMQIVMDGVGEDEDEQGDADGGFDKANPEP